jgi:hypothetical protein
MLVKKFAAADTHSVAPYFCVRGFFYTPLVPGIQIASCKLQAPDFAALLRSQMWM